MSTLGVVVAPRGGPHVGALLGGVSLADRAVAALRSCPDVDHVLVLAPGEGPPDVQHTRTGHDHADPDRAGLDDTARAGADVVVLHDASFPLVDAPLVAAVLAALLADPDVAAAVAVLPVTDTLKRVAPDGAVLATVDRTALRVAGSPQAYRPHLLPEGVLPDPADAAALPRALVEVGRQVVLVDAPPAAFRVRTDLDVLAAGALLAEAPAAPGGGNPGAGSPTAHPAGGPRRQGHADR